MIPVSITEEISRACPALHLLVLEGTVRNGASPEALWATVEAEAEHIRNSCQLVTPVTGAEFLLKCSVSVIYVILHSSR